MSLADAVLTALRGFADEVATWTNQGTLTSITGHIAQIENAVATDIHAGETAAKAVLADLYGAFHGNAPAEPTPMPPVASSEAPSTESAPTAAQASAPAPATVDPTSAPGTTAGASSAPSNTPSASATDTPATPAAPAV